MDGMAFSDGGMYILVVSVPITSPQVTPGLLARNLTRSPVGGVSMAGCQVNSRGVSDTPMRILGSYALVYLLAGEGFYVDARRPRVPVRAGDLIVVLPDVPHAYGPAVGVRWDEVYLVFDGAVFDAWRAGGLLSEAGPRHHLQPLAYWHQRFLAAAGTIGDTGPAAGLASACRVQQLLTDVLDATATAHRAPDRAWAERAKGILDALAARPVDDRTGVLAASRQVGMGYEGFRKRFTRLTGVSPGRYYNARVIDRACHLLAANDTTTLAEVAKACGFCDAFHFSRRFKQLVGMSPTDFRRRLPSGSPDNAMESRD
jgi:AraC-like DNA-binding protein